MFKGMITIVSYSIGILFMFGNGYYFVDVFDLFGATFPLLIIALFECLAVLFYAGRINDDGGVKDMLTAGIYKCAIWIHSLSYL